MTCRLKNGHCIISILSYIPFIFALSTSNFHEPTIVHFTLNECLKKRNVAFINIKVFIDVYIIIKIICTYTT